MQNISKKIQSLSHGSLVEYLGPKLFQELQVPTFGNRNILEWEEVESVREFG